MVPRKRLRLAADVYVGRGWFFVTICTFRRVPFLGRPRIASWVIQKMRAIAAADGFILHAWCVMPDHVHLFVEGATVNADLRGFVAHFKRRTSFDFSGRFGRPMWQRNLYDHVVRSGGAIDPIFWYVWMNPVRKGICADYREFAFSGSESVDWRRKEAVRVVWEPPWKAGGEDQANRKSDGLN